MAELGRIYWSWQGLRLAYFAVLMWLAASVMTALMAKKPPVAAGGHPLPGWNDDGGSTCRRRPPSGRANASHFAGLSSAAITRLFPVGASRPLAIPLVQQTSATCPRPEAPDQPQRSEANVHQDAARLLSQQVVAQPGAPLGIAVDSRIAEAIHNGLLTPGSMIPTETELGTDMKVSRTVVREALMLLEEDGLIRARRGVGAMSRTPPDRHRSHPPLRGPPQQPGSTGGS